MAELTPHVAEARRAAAHVLWAACGGGTLEEAAALMRDACNIWPDQPLMVGKGSPLADSPSFESWRRARAALEAARTLQGERLNIDWAQREKAEALIATALGENIPAEAR